MQIDVGKWKQWQTLFSWAPNTLWMVTTAMKLKDAFSLGEKKMTDLNSVLKKQRHHFAEKVHIIKAVVFPVVMCELDHKESWAPENLCFHIVVLEKILDSSWTGRWDQSILKAINFDIHQKDWCWSSSTSVTWCKELTYSERTWCWERLWAGGERKNRGWDDWMTSLTQWTWVWANSWRWWRTRKPDLLQFMGSQRVGHNWLTGQQL